MAWHHPLWPIAALAVFWLWCLLAAWRPHAWLFVIPACLPFLNFSPWTGWLIFDELDLLLLGALTGGYSNLLSSSTSRAEHGVRMPVVYWVLTILLACTSLVALYRGIADAGGYSFNWFAGYTDPMNSVRVFKSLGFALLFVPLMQHTLVHSRGLADRHLAGGILTGLTVVTLAVLWERAAFPGLLDFSKHYRTVALFWEMHVGGGAIDAYLALTTPFIVWALVCARRPVVWTGAAVLALLVAYACLTTFSRGVYFAIVGSLMLLGILVWAQKSDFSALRFLGQVLQQYGFGGWRPKAAFVLVLALVAEVVVVLGGGSFMTERLASTDSDFARRLKHWQHGLELLNGPADWFLGKGFGRFPASYAAHVPLGELSGSIKLRQEFGQGGSANGFVTVNGPAFRPDLGRLFALTQRVSEIAEGPHRVNFQVRVHKETDVYVELCERHLLYDGNCQAGFVRVLPEKATWQTSTLALKGWVSAKADWHVPRLHMLSLSIANVGGAADFDDIRLVGPQQHDLLENGQFSQGLAHWFPAAQFYFVPWHIDSFFLEVLIERGMVTLLLLAALTASALWHLVLGDARLLPLSPYLAASLSAAMLLGLFSSFMDVPRVAFLYYVLTHYSLATGRNLN